VVRSDDSSRAPQWQVVVPKFTLMADPHCEDDAERYHELKHGVHLANDFDHRRVTRLRICCLQPSPLWREYGLRQLRFYSVEVPLIPSLQPPPSLTPAEREMASGVVEQLVGLGVVASQIRSTISGGVAAANTMRQATRSVFDGGGMGNSTATGSGTSSSGGAAMGSGGGGGGSGSGGSGTAGRRAEQTLAPYIIGEWSDEWRLTGADQPAPTQTRASHRQAEPRRF
jgi:hypothetical protein